MKKQENKYRRVKKTKNTKKRRVRGNQPKNEK